jgi:hypothetical protein
MKMFTDEEFKEKQISSLINNAGYQTHRKNYYEPYLKGRNYYIKHIANRAALDGFSTKYPKFYGSLSSGGKRLKDLNKINFINKFYNDKINHEYRTLLNKLLNFQHPEQSLKQQKRDGLNAFNFGRNRANAGAPSSDLVLRENNNFLNA